MDFTAILDGIEAEGKQQIQKIENETSRILNDINRTAESLAGERRERILFDGRTRLNRERTLIEQQAAVHALKVHADARQKLIETALKNVQQSFESIRSRKDYEIFLSNTVDEVISSLTPSLIENQGIVLHFDPRDTRTVEKIMTHSNTPITIRFDIKTSGGCTGESDDGHVVTLNTIESRFAHAGQMIQQELSIFFEDKISSE